MVRSGQNRAILRKWDWQHVRTGRSEREGEGGVARPPEEQIVACLL